VTLRFLTVKFIQHIEIKSAHFSESDSICYCKDHTDFHLFDSYLIILHAYPSGINIIMTSSQDDRTAY